MKIPMSMYFNFFFFCYNLPYYTDHHITPIRWILEMNANTVTKRECNTWKWSRRCVNEYANGKAEGGEEIKVMPVLTSYSARHRTLFPSTKRLCTVFAISFIKHVSCSVKSGYKMSNDKKKFKFKLLLESVTN